jgi:hypothetical protein
MLLTILAAAALGTAPAVPDQQLRAEIASVDAELFDVVFVRCDPARLRALLAPDVEFYHDKDGFIFRSADDFVKDHEKKCPDRKKSDSWRSRRELIASTLIIDPIPGHGAMEAGEHVFYERKGAGPERLAGSARFAMVWKKSEAGWRLSRILSFAHKAAK